MPDTAAMAAAAKAAFEVSERLMAQRYTSPDPDTVVYRALRWDEAHTLDRSRWEAAIGAAVAALSRTIGKAGR